MLCLSRTQLTPNGLPVCTYTSQLLQSRACLLLPLLQLRDVLLLLWIWYPSVLRGVFFACWVSDQRKGEVLLHGPLVCGCWCWFHWVHTLW